MERAGEWEREKRCRRGERRVEGREGGDEEMMKCVEIFNTCTVGCRVLSLLPPVAFRIVSRVQPLK